MEKLMEMELKHCLMERFMMVSGQMGNFIKESAHIQMGRSMTANGEMGNLLDLELRHGLMEGNMMAIGDMENQQELERKFTQMEK